MQKIVISDSASTFTRISKAEARKLWGKEDIEFCPIKLRPGFPWASHMLFFQSENDAADFDKVVREFEHDNCTSKETGKYAAFYLVTERGK